VPRRAEAAGPDDQLLAACLKGEQAAWDTLVDRYAALIYSIPLKYGFREADAADVFQSVCVTLLEKLGTLREPRGLAAWIITTTSRQCLAVVRRQARERNRSVGSLVAVESEVVDPDLLPEDELLALERQYMIRSAVRQLPPTCRRLVEALFADALGSESESKLEETSYRQLADRLGVSINSLGPTRARCLGRLRRLLTAAGYTP
jgi:RNA polymerase sigma factor (sigma-70 family)